MVSCLTPTRLNALFPKSFGAVPIRAVYDYFLKKLLV